MAVGSRAADRGVGRCWRGRLAALVALSLVLGLLVWPVAVSAAGVTFFGRTVAAGGTLFVRTDGDDTLCDGSTNAPIGPSEPACAFETIQHAVTVAPPRETIIVAAGNYAEQVTIDHSLTLTGADVATIDPVNPNVPNTPLGKGNIALVAVNNDAIVTMSGFTLVGRATCGFNNYGVFVSHGAMLNLIGATVQNITDNNSCGATTGVGIQVGANTAPPADKAGSARITGVTVTGYKNNGILVDSMNSSATITGSTIGMNDPLVPVANKRGVGIDNQATATIDHNTISGNARGVDVSNQATATIDHNTIKNLTPVSLTRGIDINNEATATIDQNTISGYDGGIARDFAGDVSITGNAISGNNFGIALAGRGSANVISNVLSNNSIGIIAQSSVHASVQRTSIVGPGTFGIEDYDAVLDLSNSTISGYQGGGGIRVGLLGDATATLTDVTIANNGSVGVRLTSGSATLTNTLLDNNGTNCSGPITDGGYNLDSGTTCPFTSDAHDVVNKNPLLEPIADNGDTATPHTLSHALAAGSPAIDAGGTGSGCLPTDQLGTSRPQGSACDIGAFELKSTR